jgi:hypothetical protein
MDENRDPYDDYKALFNNEELLTIPNIYDFRNSAKRFIDKFTARKQLTREDEMVLTRDCIITLAFLYQIPIGKTIRLHVKLVDISDKEYRESRAEEYSSKPKRKKSNRIRENESVYFTREELKQHKQFLDEIFKKY